MKDVSDPQDKCTHWKKIKHIYMDIFEPIELKYFKDRRRVCHVLVIMNRHSRFIKLSELKTIISKKNH